MSSEGNGDEELDENDALEGDNPDSKEDNDGEDKPANMTPLDHELEEEEQDLVQTEEEAKFSQLDDYICGDIFQRLQAFQMMAQSSSDLEEILTSRINCLS